MNYFRILRCELLKQFLQGKLTTEQASEIAQRINETQKQYFGRGKHEKDNTGFDPGPVHINIVLRGVLGGNI